MPETFNLDDGINEYIEFIVCGIKYKYKQLNGTETAKMNELVLAGDPKEVEKYLYQFIEKTDESSPDFSETSKKMINQQWTKFKKMLESVNNE